MNLKEIIDLSYNTIDEIDYDEQIEVIVKGAINEAYVELAKIDTRIGTAYVPVINRVLTLPEGCLKIIETTPSLDSSDKVHGNSIITDKTGVIEMIYALTPEKLKNDDDIPEINEFLHEALSLYACYKYYMHRKKVEMANGFYSRYMQKINDYKEVSADMLSCVNDCVVIEY